MRPTRVQPKRSDFVTFDDYFDAMIQYHLESAQQNLEDGQAQVKPIQPRESPRMRVRKRTAPDRYYRVGTEYAEGKQAWIQQLQQFVQQHLQ